MIYTSGSTGTPHGVEVTRGNLKHSTEARSRYYKESVEAFLVLSSFAFDSSIAGIFWTLRDGGKLCLLPDKDQYNPAAMAEMIAKENVPHLLGVPSLYDIILIETRAQQMTSLKAVIVAGEVCPPALVTLHHQHLPQCALFNEYGPTETTVWATVHRCEPGETPVPIGRPIPNTQVYVLDDEQRALPPGFSGELYIGGAGVTNGYFNDAALTQSCFLQNPFEKSDTSLFYRTGDKVGWRADGILEFLGRFDDQVQLHGLRIELGEIENALRSHQQVNDAVVSIQTSAASLDYIAEALDKLPPNQADEILREFETTESRFQRTIKAPGFEFKVDIHDPDFVRPPRDEQRQWLLNQALHELRDDLDHLNNIAKRFAKGSTDTIKDYDIAQRALSDDEIMEDWQTPS